MEDLERRRAKESNASFGSKIWKRERFLMKLCLFISTVMRIFAYDSTNHGEVEL